jgi:hypothetical protein
VRGSINTDCLPEDHHVNKDACQLTNAGLQRVLVPVLSDSKAEVVRMELPEEISKIVELLSLFQFPAAKASNGNLHGEDAEEHVQIGSLANP